MTIIGIPSFGSGGLNSNLNPRFGRCAAFTFVTVENGEIEKVKTVPNNAANAMGGAGIQAAQIIGNNGASAVIVGNLGPNAAQALSSLNLDIYQAPAQQITVKEAVEKFIKGELQNISGANVGAHYGMGGGGRGMGGGGGRGMGGGMGGGRRRNM
jgi:predicted Fe-Mo cluster-binding NifX family protein